MSYSSFEELKILKFSGLFHCSVIKFLTYCLMRQLVYIIILSVTCQQLFSFVLNRLISALIVQDRLCWLAERMGFEPMRPWRQTVFKTAPLWPLRYLSIAILLCRTSDLIILSSPHLFVNTLFEIFSKFFRLIFYDEIIKEKLPLSQHFRHYVYSVWHTDIKEFLL